MRGLAVGGMEVRRWTGVGAGPVGKVEVLGELARLLRHRHLADQFSDPLRDLPIGQRRRCRGCLLSQWCSSAARWQWPWMGALIFGCRAKGLACDALTRGRPGHRPEKCPRETAAVAHAVRMPRL